MKTLLRLWRKWWTCLNTPPVPLGASTEDAFLDSDEHLAEIMPGPETWNGTNGKGTTSDA